MSGPTQKQLLTCQDSRRLKMCSQNSHQQRTVCLFWFLGFFCFNFFLPSSSTNAGWSSHRLLLGKQSAWHPLFLISCPTWPSPPSVPPVFLSLPSSIPTGTVCFLPRAMKLDLLAKPQVPVPFSSSAHCLTDILSHPERAALNRNSDTVLVSGQTG